MTYNESQNKATMKYKAKAYKRIPLEVQKEYYEQIKAAADSQGESVNGFIKKAIEMRIDALK